MLQCIAMIDHLIIHLTECVIALSDFSLFRTGVRAAVDWLFIRVQNSRRCVSFLKKKETSC